ncbi:hypothetical protein BCF44_108100 [Kutzneria buriramensis]|uniref:Spermidine synthase n=1 Tax=Kutzneria buriramensis TaxID=1045776 RepID=A0A3E0HFQ3_9PSEU|nr:hypothetical protein BCF44_108100 [Kutzneria buriramensis]
MPQSYVDIDDPSLLAFDVMRRIGDVVDCLPPGPVTAVHIGGAACTLPWYIASRRPGSSQVVYEPDDLLVDLLAPKLDTASVPGLTVEIADGRAGLAARADASADLIVLDAFESGHMPSALGRSSSPATSTGCCPDPARTSRTWWTTLAWDSRGGWSRRSARCSTPCC